MNKIAIIIGIIAIILASCQQTTEPQENIGKTIIQEETLSSIITIEELSSHNTRGDCWVSYQKKVYDVTSYIIKHPGGAGAIIPYCGTSEEFEKAFDNQHGLAQLETLKREGILKGELE